LIGNLKNRPGLGIALSFLVGRIGWLIAALLPAEDSKCRDCGGIANSGARKCEDRGSFLAKSNDIHRPCLNELGPGSQNHCVQQNP
jgi:hypothetical protein